jgi:hypothetical protein
MEPRLPTGPSTTDLAGGRQVFSPVSAPPPERIRIENGALVWQFRVGGKAGHSHLRTLIPDSAAFERFLRLSDATDSKILAFAKRSGVLGLCHHGIPICHGISRRPGDESVTFRSGERLLCGYTFGRLHSEVTEPLESWRRLSASAEALLRLQFSFDVMTREDRRKYWMAARWLCDCLRERCGESRFRPLRPDADLSAERNRTLITMVSSLWLKCGGVTPALIRNRDKYWLTLDFDLEGFPNLFGHLAVQLALSLASQKGWVVCSSCNHPFDPEHNRVRPGRRTFCRECRKAGRSVAAASRDYRARKRRSQPKDIPPLR